MKTLKHYIIKNINEGFKIGKTKGKTYTCQPKDRDELKKIIKERLKNNKNADLNDIDVSKITDMSQLFLGLDPHNIDISDWNVSNVKDMGAMFYMCQKFNSDLSAWDVSQVESMHNMFCNCKKFDSDLSKWDVSNVDNMYNMFGGCNISLPSWYKS